MINESDHPVINVFLSSEERRRLCIVAVEIRRLHSLTGVSEMEDFATASRNKPTLACWEAAKREGWTVMTQFHRNHAAIVLPS